MGDVIEISPSPELEPRTIYRPLRRKRDLDSNESVIELSDSTDSQSSAPSKRVKRRKEAAESRAGPSTSSNVSAVRSRASRCDRMPAFHFSFALTSWYSPRVIGRTPKLRGQTPASRHASAVPQRDTPPVQKPQAHSVSVSLLGQELGVQARPLTPPATTGAPEPGLSNHQPTPPLEHGPLPHESLPPVPTPASEVTPEPHERLVERVREVVPDVLPAHVFDLLAARETVPHNDLLNVVIHILLEDRSYPKDIKGKGKARATGEKSAEISGDTNTKVDYTCLDASRRLGRVYRNLTVVRINVPFFRKLLTRME
jgi:TRIAD3 protein (E3 ubiquitin-protein ligase RNF216)